jgi:hypothetical protein
MIQISYFSTSSNYSMDLPSRSLRLLLCIHTIGKDICACPIYIKSTINTFKVLIVMSRIFKARVNNDGNLP